MYSWIHRIRMALLGHHGEHVLQRSMMLLALIIGILGGLVATGFHELIGVVRAR